VALYDALVRSTGYVVIQLKTGKFQPEYAGYAQRDVMPKSSFMLAC
jgi:hypothetical protein